MESRWSDEGARRSVERYHQQGVAEDLALRVYSTRLLGADPTLVLHGGGNTSLKTEVEDITGAPVEVLCVKGSGWDMASIEPAGLPAVRLEPLRRLRGLEALSDEEMVDQQRGNLMDSRAPNPSVEALLHAFLPHPVVDHTHANAVLALTDQPDGEAICAELYDGKAPLVPYIMPGFGLAKAAAEIAEADPDCEGLILLKHGVFSFGATAQESYERMIALVDMAERRLASGARKPLVQAVLPEALARPAEVAPLLRGLIANPLAPEDGRYQRFVLSFRSSPEIRGFVDGAELARYSQDGTVTPDHAIRTKPRPLVLPAPAAGDPEAFARDAAAAVEAYRRDYLAYFERHNARVGGHKTVLDPAPRILLVPGVGLFGAGKSAKDAAIAADLAEANIAVIAEAEAIGRYQTIPEADQFDMEYWSLEQAKLGKGGEKPLARHVVAITGAAGAIGAATAAAFAEAGAETALLDRDEAALEAVTARLGGLALTCDLTDRSAIAAAFERICETYGGLDILVSNAGGAWQGPIGEVEDATLRASFEINFFAHQAVAQAAVGCLRKQRLGGALLFNASKAAVNPGPLFGPYAVAKAAMLGLMRQYAVEYGKEGIRANAINADRVRSALLNDELIRGRAEARGVSVEAYMRGNLLGREIRPEDVGRAFVTLALSDKSSGTIFPVDGGNMAAAPR